jgi:hypothetical protein
MTLKTIQKPFELACERIYIWHRQHMILEITNTRFKEQRKSKLMNTAKPYT